MAQALVSLPRACGALAALALALPLPLAAHAEVRGSLQLLDFGWSVVDLTPNDGIAASVTFDGQSFESSLRAGVAMRGVDGKGEPLPFGTSLSRSWAGNVAFPNASRALTLPGSQGSAHIGGNAAGGSYDFVLQGQGSRAAGPAQAYSGFAAGSSVTGNIVLAPNTELVWTGRLSMSVEKTGSGAGMRHERVQARFGMHMESEDPIFWEDYDMDLDTYGRAPGRLTHEEQLRFVFSNISPYVVPATFQMGMGLEAYSSMNPVPEPGTVGLMLAGVGVVGFVARRRPTSRREAEQAR
jgi:hypothetical protein